MNNYYKSLPSWAKGTIIVGGAVVAFIIFKTIMNKFKENADKNSALQQKKYATDEIKNLYNQGIKQTLSNSQLESICQVLAQAFDGCGTDNNTVFNEFDKLQNEADMQSLLKMYGVRKYDGCNWEGDFYDKNLSLSGAISSEMNTTQIKKINSILGKKGIKFRF